MNSTKLFCALLAITLAMTLLSCIKDDMGTIKGCTDPRAANYNPDATKDDGSCDEPCLALPEEFTGSYLLSYDSLAGGWEESFAEEIVTLDTVPGHPVRRQFEALFLAIFDGPVLNIEIEVSCEGVVFQQMNTGIGCGDSIILFPGTTRQLDILDSEADIVVSYIEDSGDCAFGTPERTVRLIRQ